MSEPARLRGKILQDVEDLLAKHYGKRVGFVLLVENIIGEGKSYLDAGSNVPDRAAKYFLEQTLENMFDNPPTSEKGHQH